MEAYGQGNEKNDKQLLDTDLYRRCKYLLEPVNSCEAYSCHVDVQTGEDGVLRGVGSGRRAGPEELNQE